MGTDGSTLLVVGEGPGEHEDRQGRPFIGASGKLLRQLLAELWPGIVVIDNATRCMAGSRDITAKHLTACRPYLAQTFVEAKADRIVTLGATAATGLVGRSFPPYSTRRGYGFTSTGTPVFYLLHPAAALRNRFVRAWLEEDLRWALKVDPADLMQTPTEGQVFLVQTPEESARACTELSAAEWVVPDAETFGAVHDADYRLLSLSLTAKGSDDAFVWEGPVLRDADVAGPLCRLLVDLTIKKVGQNSKFDAAAIRAALGVQVRGWHGDARLWRKLLQADALADLDTMQALVGMGGGKDAIEPLLKKAARQLQAFANKGKPPPQQIVDTVQTGLGVGSLDTMRTALRAGASPKRYSYAALPPDVRVAYNARDTVSTARLGVLMEARLRAHSELWSVWTDVVAGLSHAIEQLEWNGIGASKPAVYQLQSAMAAKEAEAHRRLMLYGAFNPNSTKDVSELLYTKLGLPIMSVTDTGKPSTDKESLGDLDHPVVRDLLEYRRVTKFKSLYADGMLEHMRGDGRIHPNYLIDGTETGRPSARNPNMLNVPRPKSTEGKMCRDIFIATPGHLLLEGDYSQIELRVAAMLSRDPTMIGMFTPDAQGRTHDFHLATAKMIAPMLGQDPDAITKESPLRDQAKIVNFGVLYGKGAIGLAVELKITKPKAQALIDAIFGKFRKLHAWIQESLSFARKQGFCRTWWNGREARVRPLHKIADQNQGDRETAERSSWNTRIQGTAAEFTNASLGAIQRWIDDEGIPARLVLTVYDSILIEVREHDASEVAGVMRQIMTGWRSDGVPIEVEFKLGSAWGSMQNYESH